VRALGETVCRARKLAGLSQVALADRAGISQGAVSRLENGQGTDAPLRSVMGVLGALADSLRSLPGEVVPDDVLWLIGVPQLAPWSPPDTPPSGGDLQLKALIERHRAMSPADRDLFVRAALALADAMNAKPE
jgi:transcriptional regulator with XRE-family HTH domain